MQTYLKKDHAPAHRGPSAARMPAPSMDALRAGMALPATEQPGQRVDLPSQIQAKMESAFGMDFSGVRLYRSQAVADGGAQAVTQGSRIAFAPDRLDFFSQEGQSLLGHELSHVASQARGEARGQGFLQDARLESQADREGAMAAQGESVGPATGTLSAASAVGAAGPMQAKKDKKDRQQTNAPAAPAIDDGVADRVDDTEFDPVQQTIGTGVDAFNATSEYAGDTLEDLADDGPTQGVKDFAGAAGDSSFMDVVGKTAAITGPVKSAYDFVKGIQGFNAEDDVMDQVVALASGGGSTLTGAAQGVNEFYEYMDDATSKAVGGGSQAFSGTLGAVNASRHLVRALQDDEDGDKLDQVMGAGTDLVGSVNDAVQGVSKASKEKWISKDAAGNVGAALQMVTGSAGVGSAIRHGVMADTDDKLAQNSLRKVRSEAQSRTSEEQQANDTLLDSMLSAQQRVAGVRKQDAVWEGIHGGLDALGGAASFIPVGGTAASIGIGAVQKVTDFIGQEATGQARKRAREENLGQRHMDLHRELMQKLIEEKKAQTGKTELSAYELDQCRTLAKHTVNQHLYGQGVRTNRMAGMQKTNQELDQAEALMGASGAEGARAAGSLRAAGHAIDDTGHFVSRNETQAKLNADLGSEDFEATWSSALSHEDVKRNPVMVARAKAAAKRKAKADKAAEKQRVKSLSPAEKAAEEAAAKQAKAQKKADDKRKRREQRAASKEARKTAKAAYKADMDSYVSAGLTAAGGDQMSRYDRWKKSNELKKQFKAENKAQGGARGLENTVEGAASDTNAGFFRKAANWGKSKYLHARRSHDRMRDSMVNDGWDKLSGWGRFKLAAANPLAWIASKTASGKAKSNAAQASVDEQHSMDLLNQLMSAGSAAPAAAAQDAAVQVPAAQVPAAQDAGAGGEIMDQTADPSLLTVGQKIERYESGQASNEGVDPSILTFKNKIRHLNSRIRGK